MSDQGIWFKLWDGWENDGAMAELSKEDMLHWVLLGGYLKKHGNNGMTCLSKPATALQKKLMLPNYETVLLVLRRMPNCVIEEKQKSDVTDSVTVLTIQWKNWVKYQGDSSKFRVQKWRVTHKDTDVTAREEKRRDKTRREENIPPLPQTEWFEKIWEEYPPKGRLRKKESFRRFCSSVPDVDTAKRCAAALDKYLDSKRVAEGFIQNATTWFGDWQSWENYTEDHGPISR